MKTISSQSTSVILLSMLAFSSWAQSPGEQGLIFFGDLQNDVIGLQNRG